MPILLSWLDPRYDLHKGSIYPQGINYQAHQYWAQAYTRHILLFWKEDPHHKQLERAVQALKQAFPGHGIEGRAVSFADPLDLPAVHGAVQNLLYGLREEELHLFVNPGYQMMQLSWMLCHQHLGLNTKLLQVRQARFTASRQPEVEEVRVQQSEGARALLMQTHTPSRLQALLTPSIEKVYERANMVAATADPVLITGESGTGKELLAKYLHTQSRLEGFHPANCAAVHDELLQSTLFGHKKGAFTGAVENKKGFFEEAGRGTLFLDEIGDISPLLQQSLLRVLQDRKFHRLGDSKQQETVARIVAATNQPLTQHIAEKRFRLDLYYRLSVFTLHLPSWRELPQAEREVLLNGINKQVGEASGREALVFEPAAKQMLLQHPMPGNLRQLETLLRRLQVFYGGKPKISVSDVQEELPSGMSAASHPSPDAPMSEVETWHIQRALTHFGGNKTQASKALGTAVNTLKGRLG